MKPNKKRPILIAFVAIFAVLAAFGAGIWYSKIISPEPAAEQEKIIPQSEKEIGSEIAVPATEPEIKPESEAKEIAEIKPETKPETINQPIAEKTNQISADSGAATRPGGWKNYKNDKYGFEFSYPDIYSEKNDPNVKSDESMELIANFSRGEAGGLIVKIFNDYFKNYKLIDNPGGGMWCFDTAKKLWVACSTDDPAGEYSPQKAQGDREAYIYGSGDITCAWKDIIIPHPTYAYVLQISNITCGISDEAAHDYKQPEYKLDSQEFINKFKFIE